MTSHIFDKWWQVKSFMRAIPVRWGPRSADKDPVLFKAGAVSYSTLVWPLFCQGRVGWVCHTRHIWVIGGISASEHAWLSWVPLPLGFFHAGLQSLWLCWEYNSLLPLSCFGDGTRKSKGKRWAVLRIIDWLTFEIHLFIRTLRLVKYLLLIPVFHWLLLLPLVLWKHNIYHLEIFLPRNFPTIDLKYSS